VDDHPAQDDAQERANGQAEDVQVGGGEEQGGDDDRRPDRETAPQAGEDRAAVERLLADAGEYADPWYGPIAITESQGSLTINFKQTPGMIGPLEHWAYDTFVARWPDPMIEPALVTFALDAAGKPARITMKAFSPVADFSFDYHDLEFTPVAVPPAAQE